MYKVHTVKHLVIQKVRSSSEPPLTPTAGFTPMGLLFLTCNCLTCPPPLLPSVFIIGHWLLGSIRTSFHFRSSAVRGPPSAPRGWERKVVTLSASSGPSRMSLFLVGVLGWPIYLEQKSQNVGLKGGRFDPAKE